MAAKTLLRILACSAAFCGALGAWAGVENPGSIPANAKAMEILRKLLSTGERVALNSIVIQRSACGPQLEATFRMVQDSQGRRKMVGLRPLSVQGMISCDDGERWLNYYPDEHKVVVLPSARGERENVTERLRLAALNYRFAIETASHVAGRNAFIVVAIPKSPEMATRRIAVDAVNNVLLRVETITSRGERKVLFETKSISFGQSGEKIRLDLGDGPPAKVVKPEPPVRLSRLADAKEQVGFNPISPKKLALGFVVRETLVAQTSKAKYLAMRLTDGIVNATLYQWHALSSPFADREPGFEVTIGDVRLRVMGEIPDAARLRLLESIAKEFGRSFGTSRELSLPAPTLLPSKEHEFAATYGTGEYSAEPAEFTQTGH